MMHAHKDGTAPILVFGSNLAGIHGAGAASLAYTSFGAHWGVGVGYTGNSYAIPTKDQDLKVLSLETIRYHVDTFKEFAAMNSHLLFFITAVGCGLAGYEHKEMAPLFKGLTSNCSIPEPWMEWLG